MRIVIGLLVALALIGVENVLADGEVWEQTDSLSDAAPAVRDVPPNQASDASFDKRLPPVLPGEEINDSGKTLKVWSSSGPVPARRGRLCSPMAIAYESARA